MTTEAARATKDDFHKERSHFLDAFAELEETLARAPEARQEQALIDQLKSLRAIRNDLVHSQMRFIQFAGELSALAINSQDVEGIARPARLVKLQDLRDLRTKIGQLINIAA